MAEHVEKPGPTGVTDTPSAPADRRRALVKLGLAIGAAYVAPTVLSIDRRAWAMGPSCAKNDKNC